MTFRREKIKDYFLLDTSVENLFINEYMAAAPGDFVKVYLFAQMYADLGQEITNEEIAKYLSMEHEDVLRAWTYWEKMGVIRKIRRESADKFDYDVEFVLLKEQFYGDKESKRPVGLDQSMQAAMGDKEIQEMFQAIEKASGSVLSGTEMLEIVSWINDFNATPEVIAYGYAYCVKRKKTNIKYIAAVINGWTQRGFRDVAAVEKYLSEADKKTICTSGSFRLSAFHAMRRSRSGRSWIRGLKKWSFRWIRFWRPVPRRQASLILISTMSIKCWSTGMKNGPARTRAVSARS